MLFITYFEICVLKMFFQLFVHILERASDIFRTCISIAAAAAKLLQSYLTLCNPIDGSPNPGLEPRSPALQADSLPSEPPRKPF